MSGLAPGNDGLGGDGGRRAASRRRCRPIRPAGLALVAVASFLGCDADDAPPPERVEHSGAVRAGDPTSAVVRLKAADFDRKVLGASGPVLVEFGSSTCQPCLRMAPEIERLAADVEGRAVVGWVDVDEEPALARRFAIRSIPVFLLFDEGEFVARLDGERPVGELEQRLKPLFGAAPPERPPATSQ